MRPWNQLSASPCTVHFRCMSVVDPAISLSTHSLLPMVSFIDHVDHTAPSTSKVVDDGEAPDSNEPEMGRRESRVAKERCTRVNWF